MKNQHGNLVFRGLTKSEQLLKQTLKNTFVGDVYDQNGNVITKGAVIKVASEMNTENPKK